MSTSVITVKTPSNIKKQAQEIAQNLGFSLSALVNGYLRQLIKTKTVHFTLAEEPTPFLLDALKESKEDIEAGRVVSFDNPQDAIDYLDTIIEEDAQTVEN